MFVYGYNNYVIADISAGGLAYMYFVVFRAT